VNQNGGAGQWKPEGTCRQGLRSLSPSLVPSGEFYPYSRLPISHAPPPAPLDPPPPPFLPFPLPRLATKKNIDTRLFLTESFACLRVPYPHLCAVVALSHLAGACHSTTRSSRRVHGALVAVAAWPLLRYWCSYCGKGGYKARRFQCTVPLAGTPILFLYFAGAASLFSQTKPY
jgi:hypothetical protein